MGGHGGVPGVLEQHGEGHGAASGSNGGGALGATAVGDPWLLGERRQGLGGGPQPRQAAEPPLQPCSVCVC